MPPGGEHSKTQILSDPDDVRAKRSFRRRRHRGMSPVRAEDDVNAICDQRLRHLVPFLRNSAFLKIANPALKHIFVFGWSRIASVRVPADLCTSELLLQQ